MELEKKKDISLISDAFKVIFCLCQTKEIIFLLKMII